MPPRAREKQTIDEGAELLRVQKQIQSLQQTNATLQEKVEATKDDLTEIILYLKSTVEEKDEDIARLEEILAQQDRTKREALQKEKTESDEKIRVLNVERDGLKTQITMISTQLGNQERLTVEIEALKDEVGELREVVEGQRRTIEQNETNERMVRIMAKESVRQEMSEELRVEIENTREQLQLEREAQLLMNQKVIEHLQTNVTHITKENHYLSSKLEQKIQELSAEIGRREGVEKERDHLKRLLERASSTAERSLKDMKKRVLEAENKKKKFLEDQQELKTILESQISEQRELLLNANKRGDRLEKSLLQEKETRQATVAAHASQNSKILELKDFLTHCLASDPAPDQVLGESRTAIFGQLALIVSQIPTVQ